MKKYVVVDLYQIVVAVFDTEEEMNKYMDENDSMENPLLWDEVEKDVKVGELLC